jgi:hypothetical protein
LYPDEIPCLGLRGSFLQLNHRLDGPKKFIGIHICLETITVSAGWNAILIGSYSSSTFRDQVILGTAKIVNIGPTVIAVV